MKRIEAKIRAYRDIWLSISYLCEGIKDGKFIRLSDNMEDEVKHGEITLSEAKKIQMEIYLESERIFNKKHKLEMILNKQKNGSI